MGKDVLKRSGRNILLIELAVVAFLAAAVYLLAGAFDIFEQVVEFAEAYEDWEIDELVIVAIFLSIVFPGLLLRRWSQLRREIERRVQGQEALAEAKKMQEQMMVTDRLTSIGELAAGIAHELNNPLTGIIGFSELLQRKNLPEDIRSDVDIIDSEAKRTAQIVRNLLSFARRHPQEKTSVDIEKAIVEILELRACQHKIRNIRVKTEFAPNLPEVTANVFQLQQVFMNIIINAEHFMAEAHDGGTLTIATRQVDHTLQVSIADDGPGISRENLSHVFDPFFTTQGVRKGTGLGLSICHGIVNEHGGHIYVESELGKGATFYVELPIDRKNDRDRHGR